MVERARRCLFRREADCATEANRGSAGDDVAVTGLPGVGVFHPAQRPLAALLPAARAAERLGYEEFWVAEDCFFAGGPTAAAAVLAETQGITVGIGLLPAAVRNPAITAMEIATLAELYPGRLRVAFGHGVPSWMHQIGALPERRLTVLAETVEAVRALLHGETVSRKGELFDLHDVALAAPPQTQPEVLVGSTGPRGIAIAAAAADGLLMPEGTSPEAAAAAASTMESKPIVVYAWMRVGDDGERERESLLPAVRAWAESGLYPEQVRHAGITAGKDVDNLTVGKLSVAGTPPECRVALQRLADAGCSTVLVVANGADSLEQLERFSNEVLAR